MKKNFLKNLAATLALALVVTSVAPAATATVSAAKAPSLTVTSKTIYVGGKIDINVNNKPSVKPTYKWTSSDTSNATVNSKGVVTAKTTGKATITCKITNKKTGKTIKTLKATIKVNENATAVVISNPVETVAVGPDVYDFNRTLTAKTATDKTYWVITDNTAGATVNPKNGKVSTTQVGEFKIQAVTATSRTQFEAGNTTAVSEVVTVKVPVAMSGAVQKSLNKIEVNFNTDVSKLVTKSNIAVELKGTNANSYVKSVSFTADGKVATVTVYNNFVDKKEYNVTYDKKTVDFIASVGEVAQVVVKDKTVKYAVPSDLGVTLLDANGIDVTTNTELDKVTAKITNSISGWVDAPANGVINITLYNIGDVAKVSATYATGKFDTAGKSIDITSTEATIIAVKELDVVGTVQDYTAVRNAGNPNWSKTVKNIAKYDAGKLFFKAVINGVDIDSSINTGASFESSNSNILLVDGAGNYTAVAEGTAYVTAKINGYTVVFAIEVGAVRKATSISVDKTNFTLSTHLNDASTVAVTIKDQYGDDMPKDAVIVTPLTAPTFASPKVGLNVVPGTGTAIGTADFTTVNNTATGSYQYKFTTQGLSILVGVNVSNSGDTAVQTYRVEQDATEFDLNVDANTVRDLTNNIKVFGYNAAGLKVSDQTNNVEIEVVNPYGSRYAFKAVSASTITPILETVSPSSITKNAPVGTYTIVVKLGSVIKQTASFKVVDTQALPTVSIDKIKASSLSAVSGDSITYALNSRTGNAGLIDATLRLESYVNNGVVTASAVKGKLALTGVDAMKPGTIASVTTLTGLSSQTVFVRSLTFTGYVTDKNGVDRTVDYVVTVNHNMTFLFQ